jgi:hypothetical protein
MLIAIRDVPVDEPQGYLGIINPYDFTIIVATASSIQTHLATLTNVKAIRREIYFHKNPTQRDVLNRR